MSGCGARTAAGSLEAVFESSDVERFGWILMEVWAAKPRKQRCSFQSCGRFLLSRSSRLGVAKLGYREQAKRTRRLFRLHDFWRQAQAFLSLERSAQKIRLSRSQACRRRAIQKLKVERDPD